MERDVLCKWNAGCDSIITLDLTINGSGSGDTTVLTACDSTVWGGVTYDSSGLIIH